MRENVVGSETKTRVQWISVVISHSGNVKSAYVLGNAIGSISINTILTEHNPNSYDY